MWDHDPTDDFQMPNGTSVPVNSSEEEIYSYGMTCKSRLGIHLDDPPFLHLLATLWLETFRHLLEQKWFQGSPLVSSLLPGNEP